MLMFLYYSSAIALKYDERFGDDGTTPTQRSNNGTPPLGLDGLFIGYYGAGTGRHRGNNTRGNCAKR